MNQNLSKKPTPMLLSILIFTIAIMLSGNAFAQSKGVGVGVIEYATKTDLSDAIATEDAVLKAAIAAAISTEDSELKALITTQQAAIDALKAIIAEQPTVTQAELDAAKASLEQEIAALKAALDDQIDKETKDITTVNTTLGTITPPVRHIGEHLSDGSIVFWVDETGQHGLAAQPFDDATGNWYFAKVQAENHGPGWRLPTAHELNLLYHQKEIVSGFTGNAYWSSSEVDANHAWHLPFLVGYQLGTLKGNTLSMRAVRAF